MKRLLAHLTHNQLDFVNLAGSERVISARALAEATIESMVPRVAHASVKLVAVPHLLTAIQPNEVDICGVAMNDINVDRIERVSRSFCIPSSLANRDNTYGALK